MTSQAGQIAIHILPNKSKGKGNQGIKFGESIKYSERKFFFKIHAENEIRGIFLASGHHLNFNIF